MRVIVITGASSGIGEALAKHYAGPDIVLGLIGRNAARLDAVADACRQMGASVEACILDVADGQGMAAWIADFDVRNQIDLLFANAGVGSNAAIEPTQASFDDARAMFDINIGGVVNALHAVLPLMATRKSGQVAIMASLAGYRGLAGAPAYSASKGFAKLYGEGLRGAMAPHGIKLSVICPGFVESRITARNNFKMPFFMKAEGAAAIIARGLAKNKGRIAFPLPMAFAVWLFSCLPACVADWISKSLPKKT